MKTNALEKAWIVVGAVILALFLVLISVAAFGMGMQPPADAGRVDPQRLAEDPRFAAPGVRQVSPGRYEADIVALLFSFNPPSIEVPAGVTVTFKVTSKDVIHGFGVVGTNINLMVVPGYIAEATATFNTPGEYLVLCNEYCGAGHQAMQAKLVVK
ncbi:MAG: cytochrome c oxidase subunit II [Chloroflexi bacterium]|nr:cytochrome c oxidase subunit II [Chloroflexota bacterium]